MAHNVNHTKVWSPEGVYRDMFLPSGQCKYSEKPIPYLKDDMILMRISFPSTPQAVPWLLTSYKIQI